MIAAIRNSGILSAVFKFICVSFKANASIHLKVASVKSKFVLFTSFEANVSILKAAPMSFICMFKSSWDVCIYTYLQINHGFATNETKKQGC